jgi:hypothetical protein
MTSARHRGGRSSGRSVRMAAGTARSIRRRARAARRSRASWRSRHASGPTWRATNGGQDVGAGARPWDMTDLRGRDGAAPPSRVLPLCRSGLRVSPAEAGFPRRRALGGTFQSGLVRAVRVPERFPGGVAPSAGGRASQCPPAALPPGVGGLAMWLSAHRTSRSPGRGQGTRGRRVGRSACRASTSRSPSATRRCPRRPHARPVLVRPRLPVLLDDVALARARRRASGLDIEWLPISLLLKNGTQEGDRSSPRSSRATGCSASSRPSARPGHADRIGDLYTELGRELHVDGTTVDLPSVLAGLGLDPRLASARRRRALTTHAIRGDGRRARARR